MERHYKPWLQQFTEELQIPRWSELTSYGMKHIICAYLHLIYSGQAYSNHEACFIVCMIPVTQEVYWHILLHFGFHIKTLTWNHTKPWEIRFFYEYWIFKCKLIFLFCVDTVRYHTFQGKFFKPFLKEKYFCFCLCRGGMKTIMICKTFQSLLYFPKYWVDLEDF